jgi:hypothetical protein
MISRIIHMASIAEIITHLHTEPRLEGAGLCVLHMVCWIDP